MKDWKKTSWTFEDGRSVFIQDVLDMSDEIPMMVLPIEEVIKIRTISSLDHSRVHAADISYPILIVEEDGRRWILDGNHRLQKAINEGYDAVKVKILRGII